MPAATALAFQNFVLSYKFLLTFLLYYGTIRPSKERRNDFHMKKIIGTKKISSAEYFKRQLHGNGYTTQTFTDTYNAVYPDNTISVSAVRSWCSGRRSFSNTAALTVQRIAHILDDPDSSESDYERYSGIIFHLVNGSSTIIYDENGERL